MVVKYPIMVGFSRETIWVLVYKLLLKFGVFCWCERIFFAAIKEQLCFCKGFILLVKAGVIELQE